MNHVTFCILILSLSCTLAQDLIIKNSCPYVLWAEGRGPNGILPGEKNVIKYLGIGQTVNYTIPAAGLPSTRFWVKYGCDSNGANCLMGDSVANFDLYPQTGCPATGCTAPIDSLFEATWGCKTSSTCPPTYFDTSQVDGYTLPYRVLITGNTKCDCVLNGCTNLTLIDGSGLNVQSCPNNEDLSDNGAYSQYNSQDLRVVTNGQVVGCKSPCKQMNLPSSMSGNGLADGSPQAIYYCCPTPNPNNCQISQGCILPAQCRAGPVANTQYVKVVHEETKGVYAYAYDDGVGLSNYPLESMLVPLPVFSTQWNIALLPPANDNQGNVGVDMPGGDISTGTATSGTDCAQQCDKNNNCQAWSWDYPLGCNGNSCWLKGSGVSQRVANPCRESNVKLGDKGIDRSGNDLPGMPVSLPSGSTASTCAAQCSLNQNCFSWSFDSCGGIQCWLKSTAGTTSSNSCRTSGIKGHIGADIYGNDLSMLTLPPLSSTTTCANECANTKGCNAWAMVNPIPGCQTLNWCWLKTAVGTTSPNNCVIWGSLGNSEYSTLSSNVTSISIN